MTYPSLLRLLAALVAIAAVPLILHHWIARPTEHAQAFVVTTVVPSMLERRQSLHYAVVTAGHRANLVTLLRDLVKRCGVAEDRITVFVDSPPLDRTREDSHHPGNRQRRHDGLESPTDSPHLTWAVENGYRVISRPPLLPAPSLSSVSPQDRARHSAREQLDSLGCKPSSLSDCKPSSLSEYTLVPSQ